MLKVQYFAAALTVLMLCGCASAPKARNIIYSGRVSGKFHKALINELRIASITRAPQLNADKAVEISPAAFEVALKESLRAHGLLSDSGRFQLKAHIFKIMQPPGRFNMKVTTHVKYTLVDSTSDRIVFKETIITDHTAATTDALASIKRRRLANEGSGKSNIAQFLDQLSRL